MRSYNRRSSLAVRPPQQGTLGFQENPQKPNTVWLWAFGGLVLIGGGLFFYYRKKPQTTSTLYNGVTINTTPSSNGGCVASYEMTVLVGGTPRSKKADIPGTDCSDAFAKAKASIDEFMQSQV